MLDLAVARAVPVAPLTWGLSADLPGTAAETESVALGINQPFELVALDAVVVRGRVAQQLAAPTVQDLMVRLYVNSDLRVTGQVRRGETLPAGLAREYVPLQSMLSNVRLLGLEFREAVADVSFQFRWAVDMSGAPVWDTARIMLSLFVRPIGGAR